MDDAIEVAVAVIVAPVRDRAQRYLVARRAFEDSAFPGQWEFPGGKHAPGETPHEALVRELCEELMLVTTADRLSRKPLLDHRQTTKGRPYHLRYFELCVSPMTVMEIQIGPEHSDIAWLPLSILGGMDNLTPGTRAAVDFLGAERGDA